MTNKPKTVKKIYLIVLVVVLLGSGCGLAYFLKKRKEAQKAAKAAKLKPSIEVEEVETEQEPAPVEKPAPSIPRVAKVVTKIPVETGIEISNVNTIKRTFDYNMHYGGIRHKGSFEEGALKPVVIPKAFGSFTIKQRAEKIINVKVSKERLNAAAQKLRGKSTKMSGANPKSSGMELIDVPLMRPSDYVDLSIKDAKGTLLKQISINLATGAEVGTVIHTEPWDGD